VIKKLIPFLGIVGFLNLGYSQNLVCVNGDELIKDSVYASELKQQLEEEQKQFQEKYQKKAQELLNRLKQLQKELQSGLLSDEAKKEKEKEFLKLQKELQQLQFQAQMEAQKLVMEKLKKLDKLTKAALKVLSQTEGFSAAVDCKNLLYYDPSIDITKKVAKILDQLAEKSANK
jgi:outer membrane protein